MIDLDLLADVSDPLRTFGGMVAKHLGHEVDMREVCRTWGISLVMAGI